MKEQAGLGEKEASGAAMVPTQNALPKPFYQDQFVTIYHGDCNRLFKNLGGVAAIITDPPYSAHVHANGMRGTRDRRGEIFGEVKDFGFASLSPELRDSVAGYFSVLCARWCLVFSDIESAPLWRESLACSGHFEYIRTGAWVKIAPTPQFTGDRPGSGFEAVTICHPPGRKRWNGGGKSAVWSYCAHGGDRDIRLHSAQKPIGLMAELVALFSDPGETILDPFMGSGTTLRAAKDLGRKAIGIEIEERYCEIAAKRMEQEVFSFCPAKVEEQTTPLLIQDDSSLSSQSSRDCHGIAGALEQIREQNKI